MEYEHLITLAESLSRFLGISEATLSNKCSSHARLFKRLRDGQGCSVRTYNNTLRWMSENWPSDLEWPRSIPRPKPNKKEAA